MLTTTEAAALLSERGYTVSRGRVGGKGPPAADTIKRWCAQGRFEGAVCIADRVWQIPREAIEALLTNAAERQEG